MTRVTTLLLAATALSALCACEPYHPYYEARYEGPPPPGYYGGAPYDDPCFTNEDYCGYAYYDGPIWWDGAWYGGPHRWRDWDGGRQFWVRGGWHGDVRMGDHGAWHGPGHWHQD